MREIYVRFIEWLKKLETETRIELCEKAYHNIFDHYIVRYNQQKEPIILRVFLDAFFANLNENFEEEEIKEIKEKLKLETETKIRDCKKRKREIKVPTIITKILIFCYKMVLKIAYKDLRQEKNEKTDFLNICKEIMFCNDNNQIFIYFDKLSDLLLSSPFSISESFEIILQTIELNLKVFNESENNCIPDIQKLKDHEFEYISSSRIDYLLNTNNLRTFLMSDEKSDRKAREELTQFIEQNSLDISEIKRNCQTVNEHYKESLTKSDVDFIHTSLLELNVDRKLCGKIARSLLKEISRCEETKKEAKMENKVNNQEKSKCISKKEMNLISRELENYFNFKEMKSIRPLSLNEVIYCIGLLVKISADKKTIDEFVRINEKEKRKSNPIYLYDDLYNKLQFYRDDEEVNKLLNDIEINTSNMFICSDSSYKQIKENISEDVKYILNIIGNNYEYEIKEIQKNYHLR